MDASADVALRFALTVLAAATAFAGVITLLRSSLRFVPGDAAVFAVLYWALLAASCAPLGAAWIFKMPPESTRLFVPAASIACIAGAWLALKAGHRAAVAAFVIAIVLKWLIYQLFVWTYGFVIR